MFKIGDFSKLTLVSIRMLRYYDEVGLFKPAEIDDRFTFKESESIDKAASILVPGEYLSLATAYNFLGKWIEENGYTIIGNARQMSIKGHWNETNSKDYLTEIQIPVK